MAKKLPGSLSVPATDRSAVENQILRPHSVVLHAENITLQIGESKGFFDQGKTAQLRKVPDIFGVIHFAALSSSIIQTYVCCIFLGLVQLLAELASWLPSQHSY